MAFTINAPKSWLFMPFFILLVIVLAPFALLFSLLRLPFAKRRKLSLEEIIAEDWIPRKKYIYIGYNDDLPIVEYIERVILPKYGSHIIFDKWVSTDNKWIENEPDTYRRVTTIWQDIAGDFDGDPICIMAVLTPTQNQITEEMINVYYFSENDPSLEDSEKKMISDIEAGLDSWKDAKNI